MQTTLHVEGMSCSHCESSIKETLSALEGVKEVAVDLKDKTVTVVHSDIVAIDLLKKEIEDIGYDVI